MPEQDPAIIELRKRVDSQKKVISDLRKRVVALEGRSSAAPVGATPSTDAETAEAEVSGNWWVMKPTCLTCGGPKEEGRGSKLSCKACGKLYMDQVKGRVEAKPTTTCGYCGGNKTPSLNPQCGRCQTGFKKWKKERGL